MAKRRNSARNSENLGAQNVINGGWRSWNWNRNKKESNPTKPPSGQNHQSHQTTSPPPPLLSSRLGTPKTDPPPPPPEAPSPATSSSRPRSLRKPHTAGGLGGGAGSTGGARNPGAGHGHADGVVVLLRRRHGAPRLRPSDVQEAAVCGARRERFRPPWRSQSSVSSSRRCWGSSPCPPSLGRRIYTRRGRGGERHRRAACSIRFDSTPAWVRCTREKTAVCDVRRGASPSAMALQDLSRSHRCSRTSSSLSTRCWSSSAYPQSLARRIGGGDAHLFLSRSTTRP